MRVPSYSAAAVLSMTCVVLATTRVAGQHPPAEDAIQQTTLANGLQVLVSEHHSSPIATVLVAVRNGAMTQEHGDEGLAHLYEHLLFRSYKGGSDAFEADAGSLDAPYNGSTAEEVVTYYLTLPSKNALKGIALLGRLLQNPHFRDRDLKRERPVVLDELFRAESDPEAALERQAARLLWGSSWSRKDYSGDSTSLNAIGLDRLQATYAHYYVPNNTALVVTGDVSAADVFAAAKDQFGSWARAPDPFADRPIPPIAPLVASSAALTAAPVTHTTILVEFRGPSADQDTVAPYAADVLCDVLNERGSAFQRHLVGTGLIQSVTCNYLTLAHVGPITFKAETTPASARAALSVLLDELDKLDHLDGVTEEDLTIAKKRRHVRTVLSLESSYSLAPALASWWASGGVEAYERYDARVDAQRLDDLRRVAGTYVATHPKIIAVLAPSSVIQSLKTVMHP